MGRMRLYTHDVYPSVNHSQRQCCEASHAPAREVNSPRWHYLPTTRSKAHPHDWPSHTRSSDFWASKTAGPEPPRERPPDPSARHSGGVHPHRHSHLPITCDLSLKIHVLLNPRNFRQEYVVAIYTRPHWFRLRHGGQMRQWKLLRGWSFFSSS